MLGQIHVPFVVALFIPLDFVIKTYMYVLEIPVTEWKKSIPMGGIE